MEIAANNVLGFEHYECVRVEKNALPIIYATFSIDRV